ncbi:unnamed protein product [Rotaria sp. Silwood2]|nr:unnamed protein product [Rotaria sp. Silwood2]
MFIKHKQPLLQKSIEQVDDACAAVFFPVHIKLYRRVNLAKHELLRTDQSKPHSRLISIYEYANHVRKLYATIKAHSGDCNEFHKQIKHNTLLLLLFIKESNLIPIIQEDLPQLIPEISQKKEFVLQRQSSRWSTAKYVIKLLHPNVGNLKDENRVMTILVNYLSHLRNSLLEWSGLANIQATNF